MSEAIRVTIEGFNSYIPASGKLRSMASSGVTIRGEGGPLLEPGAPTRPEFVKVPSVAFFSKDAVSLRAGETLRLGKGTPGAPYNQYADVTLERGGRVSEGLGFHGNLHDGEIVLAVFNDRVCPALYRAADSKTWVELPEDISGERFFVMPMGRNAIASVSLPAYSSNKVKVLPPGLLGAWLNGIGSRSIDFEKRFSLEVVSSNRFVIKDAKKGASYSGTLASTPEDRDAEVYKLRWLLETKGMSGVLPLYVLEKAS